MDMSKNLLKRKSLVIGVSLSGYNEEILHMLKAANQNGAFTVGITSQKDSPISKEAGTSFFIPSKDKLDHVISFVNEISHIICGRNVF